MKGLPVAMCLGQVARAGEKKRHEGYLGTTQTHITEYSDEDNVINHEVIFSKFKSILVGFT